MEDLLPKLGRKPVFNKEEELEFHHFLLHAWMIGVPRTEDLFAMDIQYTVQKTDRKTPFDNGYPGMYKITCTHTTNVAPLIMTWSKFRLKNSTLLYKTNK